MIVKVEAVSSGSQNGYRLTIPPISGNGRYSREYVRGEVWGRKQVKEALDILEQLYYIPRKKIRFDIY